jgi:hypothetical protein
MWFNAGLVVLVLLLVWLLWRSKEGMTNRGKIVMLYTRASCIHCKNLVPIWEDLKMALIPQGIQFQEYDGALVVSPDVKAYPTIFLIDTDGKKYQFEGMRTYENLRNWIMAPKRGYTTSA